MFLWPLEPASGPSTTTTQTSPKGTLNWWHCYKTHEFKSYWFKRAVLGTTQCQFHRKWQNADQKNDLLPKYPPFYRKIIKFAHFCIKIAQNLRPAETSVVGGMADSVALPSAHRSALGRLLQCTALLDSGWNRERQHAIGVPQNQSRKCNVQNASKFVRFDNKIHGS